MKPQGVSGRISFWTMPVSSYDALFLVSTVLQDMLTSSTGGHLLGFEQTKVLEQASFVNDTVVPRGYLRGCVGSLWDIFEPFL